MLNIISNTVFPIGELACINERETRILIHEIFKQNNYLDDFLSLDPGAIIIDVGANIGVFSLFALEHCKRNASIHCFEPIPLTFQCLIKNLEPYKAQVHLHNMGISNVEKDCYAEFTLFGNSYATATYRPMDKIVSNFQPLLNYQTLLTIAKFHNKSLYYQLKYLPFMRQHLIKKYYRERTRETKVKCLLTSLGTYIEKTNLDRIDFLKIDVEGAEIDVIKSIKPEQFSKIRQLSIEVHDIDNRPAQLAYYLQQQNYSTQIRCNPNFAKLGFNHHMLYAKKE